MYSRGRWRGWAVCCEHFRGQSMTGRLRARRESPEPGRADRRPDLGPDPYGSEPMKKPRIRAAFSRWEPALQRHADAHGHRLIVAVILVGGRADADEPNQVAAQIGAGADVEQDIVVVSPEHGNRKGPGHRDET